MADFVSEFWNWFIIVPTVAGFIALVWLLRWMGEKPSDGSAKPKSMGHVWDEDLEELNNPLPKWWLGLFHITLVFGAVYLILYPGLGNYKGLLGWSQENRYQEEVAKANKRFDPLYEKWLQDDLRTLVHDRSAMKTAARLFINNCTTCHSSDAGGSPGFPSLRDRDWLYGGAPEAIKASILDGRSGVMPAWGAALGRDGAFDVTEYVLSLSGRKVNINAAAQGKVKFQQMCASCHGATAKGNTAIGAPNLTDNIWLYGGSQKTVMSSITNGRQGQMPAHKNFLGAAKVHLLAAYVYSLSAENLTN